MANDVGAFPGGRAFFESAAGDPLEALRKIHRNPWGGLKSVPRCPARLPFAEMNIAARFPCWFLSKHISLLDIFSHLCPIGSSEQRPKVA